MPKRMRLGDLITHLGYASQSDITPALDVQRADPARPMLGNVLMSLGLIDKSDLVSTLAHQLQLLAADSLENLDSCEISLARMKSAISTIQDSVDSMAAQTFALNESTSAILVGSGSQESRGCGRNHKADRGTARRGPRYSLRLGKYCWIDESDAITCRNITQRKQDVRSGAKTLRK